MVIPTLLVLVTSQEITFARVQRKDQFAKKENGNFNEHSTMLSSISRQGVIKPNKNQKFIFSIFGGLKHCKILCSPTESLIEP